jgi:hypothetical protein
MISFKKTCNYLLVVLACVLIVAAWVGVVLAIVTFFEVFIDIGGGVKDAALNSQVAYFGILSFGLSSCAVILIGRSGIKIKYKILLLFKLTFFVSAVLVIPVILIAPLCFFIGE